MKYFLLTSKVNAVLVKSAGLRDLETGGLSLTTEQGLESSSTTLLPKLFSPFLEGPPRIKQDSSISVVNCWYLVFLLRLPDIGG